MLRHQKKPQTNGPDMRTDRKSGTMILNDCRPWAFKCSFKHWLSFNRISTQIGENKNLTKLEHLGSKIYKWLLSIHLYMIKKIYSPFYQTYTPVRRQAITWTYAGLLSIGLLGTNFSEIWIWILSFSFKKMHSKLSSVKMSAILSRGRWDNPAFP